MQRRVTLIGYRASGKTTVGRMVGERLGWRFIDADRFLEEAAGRSVANIFADDGEAAFRERESTCLAEILAGDQPLALATGGGCVLRPENRSLLQQRGGLVVYLCAPAAVLQARLRANAGGRPALSGGSMVDEVPKLLAQREPLYRQTAGQVVRADRPLDQVAAEVLVLVEK